jgi:hypothetical protein
MPRPRKPLMPGLTEAQVQEPVLEYLRGCLGLDVARRNVGAALMPSGRFVRFNEPGDPDIGGQLPDGRAFGVETKAPGKWPTEVQIDRLRRINDRGGVAFWVTDVSQVIAVMPRILAGWRIEIDGDGYQWITDEPREDT